MDIIKLAKTRAPYVIEATINDNEPSLAYFQSAKAAQDYKARLNNAAQSMRHGKVTFRCLRWGGE